MCFRLFALPLCVLAMLSLPGCGGSEQPAPRANAQLASVSQVSASVINTLRFSGNRSQYGVVVDGDAITVTDNLGLEEAKRFSGPNLRFTFADVTVGFDVDGAAGQVYRLYKAAFNRQPDPEGLGFHLSAMETLGYNKNQIAQNFINSPEFTATYGPLDDVQFITQLYRNVLGRLPDAAGLQFYVDGLKAHSFSKSAVLEGFSESPENKTAVQASVRGGIAYQAQPGVPGPVPVLDGVTSPIMAKVDYRTATQSGTTGADGVFHYRPGELVTFSIGAIELASVPAAAVVTPLQVDDPVAGANALRLAKALDADYTLSNGIVFPPAPKGATAPVDFGNEADVKKMLAKIDPIVELPAVGDTEVETALVAAVRKARLGSIYTGTYSSFWLNRSSSCAPLPTDLRSATFNFTTLPDWDKHTSAGTLTLTLENGSQISVATAGMAGTSPQGYEYSIARGDYRTKGRVIRIGLKPPAGRGCDAISMFLRDKAQPNLAPIPSSGIGSIFGSQRVGHSYTVSFAAAYGGPMILPTTALDFDGRVVSQEWSTSDGAKGTGSSFAVVVPAFSQVTVTLTATDDEGARSTKTWTMGSSKKTLAEVLDLLAANYYVAKDGPYSTYYKTDLTRNRVFEYECDDRLRGCEENVYNVAELDTKSFLENLYLASGSEDFVYVDKITGEVSRFTAASTLPVGYQIVKGSAGGGGGGGSGPGTGAGAGGGPGSGNGTGETTGVTGSVIATGGTARSPDNDPGTPTKVELCVKRGNPAVLTPPPPDCYRSSNGVERAYAFEDGLNLNDVVEGVYSNDDFQFYKAQDLSAPYCTDKGTVNGLPAAWLCRVFFTIGR